jgi:hypothetical protein
MTNPYPQGSVWRRWDLHVHTPDSFEHSFGEWPEYVDALWNVHDVSVRGVTDYFLIDGYRKIWELRNKGDLKNFDLVLPNIELRLDTFVPKRSDGTKLKRLNYGQRWKLVHRHADPITTARPAESMLGQRQGRQGLLRHALPGDARMIQRQQSASSRPRSSSRRATPVAFIVLNDTPDLSRSVQIAIAHCRI